MVNSSAFPGLCMLGMCPCGKLSVNEKELIRWLRVWWGKTGVSLAALSSDCVGLQTELCRTHQTVGLANVWGGITALRIIPGNALGNSWPKEWDSCTTVYVRV